MSALSQCTVLIPTHNRPEYLARCVRWFSEFECPIVIADSSPSLSCGGFQSDRIRHLHFPGGFEVYAKKLQLALQSISTPFVVACADDDFIAKQGLVESVGFMQANPDYSSTQGYAYLYQAFGSRVVLWPMIYPFHNNVSENWLERIESAKSTVWYGVNRTSVLGGVIDFLCQQDFSQISEASAGFMDTAISAHVARAGKFRRCEVPFSLREYSANVSSVGRRISTIVSRNVPDFYRNLLAAMTDGDSSQETQERLLRLFASDYAGQISFDLSASGSRMQRLQGLPKSMLRHAEYLFRLYGAAKLYSSSEYRRFLKVFSSEDYRRLKTFVVEGSTL